MTHSRFRKTYDRLRARMDRRLSSLVARRQPRALTDACRYVLAAGGKRVRGTLVVLSCEAVGGSAAQALDAGLAVEMMHNFTLVHDDIMDNSPSRRGRPTVHTRWDLNNALLVGDVLIGMGYRQLLRSDSRRAIRATELFTRGLLEVCEGQGLDLEFERRDSVSLREYFTMIEKKTARLISMSAELGAVIGGGSLRQTRALRRFGHCLGRAFQIQDDLLDVVADQKRLGKPVGGDILEGKRTFLLITALGRARGSDRKFLRSVLHPSGTRSGLAARKKIAGVTAIYRQLGVLDAARDQIARDTRHATAALRALPHNRATRMLHWFSDMLLNRTS